VRNFKRISCRLGYPTFFRPAAGDEGGRAMERVEAVEHDKAIARWENEGGMVCRLSKPDDESRILRDSSPFRPIMISLSDFANRHGLSSLPWG
jgi:hypothetical protein